jgi:hypothetical protein
MKPEILLLLRGLALALFSTTVPATIAAAPDARPRLVVLADMGNEPDEDQQIFHLLMCSNLLEIEGLIAVSGKHLRPEDKRAYRQILHPELFHLLIHGYAKVQPNLLLHAPGWPAPEYLHGIVASGQTGYGVASTGPGKFSAGSRLITAVVEKPDPRPVHIIVNAGSNTLAQALIDYRATHTPAELRAFVAKLIVFENQAQDDAGAWVCREFPDIHWIRSRHQTRGYGGPTDKDLGPHIWKPYAYSVRGQHDWAREHIVTGHGPFGAIYPERVYADLLHFIEGGGTIPWLRLVSPGLTDPTEPSWGGWSGRYTAEKVLNVPSPYADIALEEKSSQPFATYSDFGADVRDRWTDPADGKLYHDNLAPIWHWRVAMWNDLQARMDWCVQPFAKANHHPRAVLDGDTSDTSLRRTAKPGDTLKFDASASTDPDGDALRFSWWIYPEAGRRPYGQPLALANATAPAITFIVPADAAGKELHLILEVWDQSKIVPLVDYRRVVIAVAP